MIGCPNTAPPAWTLVEYKPPYMLGISQNIPLHPAAMLPAVLLASIFIFKGKPNTNLLKTQPLKFSAVAALPGSGAGLFKPILARQAPIDPSQIPAQCRDQGCDTFISAISVRTCTLALICKIFMSQFPNRLAKTFLMPLAYAPMQMNRPGLSAWNVCNQLIQHRKTLLIVWPSYWLLISISHILHHRIYFRVPAGWDQFASDELTHWRSYCNADWPWFWIYSNWSHS